MASSSMEGNAWDDDVHENAEFYERQLLLLGQQMEEHRRMTTRKKLEANELYFMEQEDKASSSPYRLLLQTQPALAKVNEPAANKLKTEGACAPNLAKKEEEEVVCSPVSIYEEVEEDSHKIHLSLCLEACAGFFSLCMLRFKVFRLCSYRLVCFVKLSFSLFIFDFK